MLVAFLIILVRSYTEASLDAFNVIDESSLTYH